MPLGHARSSGQCSDRRLLEVKGKLLFVEISQRHDGRRLKGLAW